MTTRIALEVVANLLGQHAVERNQDAAAYVGNLGPQVSEELLWELFVQAGPVVNVYVPKDRVTNLHQGYGFVEFRGEEDPDYLSIPHGWAIKVLNMIKLYGKPIRVNKDVDEKILYDTFSAIGVIVSNPKSMTGQYLCNRQITVSYAYKDTKGERHGTPAERVLAASNPTAQKSRPHTLFASGPPTLPNNVHQANGSLGLPMTPRPFTDGAVARVPIPAVRPQPPATFTPVQVAGQSVWQAQPPPRMAPAQFMGQPVHGGMPPPPPPEGISVFSRPPPQPIAMGVQPQFWRPPPPPPFQGGRPSVPQMSMPPPPPNAPAPPPPPA